MASTTQSTPGSTASAVRLMSVASQVKEVKDGFRESIGELKTQHADLEKKYTALNGKVVRLVTLCSVSTAVISAVAPMLLKKFAGL